MFQRVAFGSVSDFLRGLGDHLTDMTGVEAVTLARWALRLLCSGSSRALLWIS